MKKVISGDNLTEKIKEALSLLCDTVKVTFGPKGNNVIINSSAYAPFVTNDGVTIARNIESDDEEINPILELLKEASIKTDDIVGDGTTTTLVLLKSIMDKCFELTSRGMSKYDIINNLNIEKLIVIEKILELSHKPSEKELEKISQIACGNESDGTIIYEVFKKIKNKEGIEIVTSKKTLTNVIYFNGYTIDTILAHEYYFKDKNEIIINRPYVIATNEALYDLEQISFAINEVIKNKRNLVIVASDYQEDFINNIISLNIDNNINIYLLKNPEALKNAYYLTNDLLVVGSMSELHSVCDYENIGSLPQVIINKNKTIFCFNQNNDIESYVKNINIDEETSDFENDYNKKRKSMLSSGLAKIEVGAQTMSECREKKLRFDDAISAINSSLDNVTLGGGVTYYKIASTLKDETILKYPLTKPFEQILENAGMDYNIKAQEMLESNYNKIYNVKTGLFEDVKNTNVIDSTKVLIEAINNAISIASLLLNTNSLVINEVNKNYTIDHEYNI